KVFINDVFAFQSGHFDTRLNHSYLSGDTYYTFHNRFDGFDVKLDLGVNGYAAETGDRLSPYHPTLFTWLIGLLCLPMLLGGLRGGAVATYTAMVIVSISTDPTRKPAQRYALAFEWLLGGYILWTVVTGLCWVLLAAAVRS
ncbi:MAG: hypothetical protein SF029_17110, partial [bacterium]|nr:hypothetical protein [bacterium]